MANSSRTIILTKDGEQVSFNKEPASVFSMLRNGKYLVTFSPYREKRSIDQNSLMWMWFTCISQETGTPVQDVHDYYCAKFLRKQIDWNGTNRTVIEGTRNLRKDRMTEFLNNVQADALTEFGIKLPLPEDLYFEEFCNTFR